MGGTIFEAANHIERYDTFSTTDPTVTNICGIGKIGAGRQRPTVFVGEITQPQPLIAGLDWTAIIQQISVAASLYVIHPRFRLSFKPHPYYPLNMNNCEPTPLFFAYGIPLRRVLQNELTHLGMA